MKIEKLTENKIRVIISSSDLDLEKIDVPLLLKSSLEGHSFIIDMLEKAKKEVGFDTDGCKLLIEASSSSEDVLVFTITKYSFADTKPVSNSPGRKLTVKRKNINFYKKQAIYKFKNFEEFCDFCQYIYNTKNFDINKFSKNISLYLYNNTYYLMVKNINLAYNSAKIFYHIASEFSTPLSFSNSFENKLIEYGKPIIKRNAIVVGIKYFSSKTDIS